MFRRVAVKLVLLSSVFTALVLVLMAALILTRAKESFTDQMVFRAKLFARTCEETLFPAPDIILILKNVRVMKEERGVAYLGVLDNTGKFLAHTDSRKDRTVDQTAEGTRALKASDPERPLIQRFREGDVEYNDISVPVLHGPNRVGTVRLGYTQASIEEALRGTKREVLGISIFVVLLAVMGTGLIVFRMMRPLPILARAAQAVGQGKLDILVRWDSGDEIGQLATEFNRMVAGLRERAKIQSLFGSFVSPEVAQLAMQGKLVPQKRMVSVLLCDIRNFTRFSEQLPPEHVVAFLNSYFQQMVDIIERHKGHVDKFIGDAILVMFGAPVELADHAIQSVSCALAMKERMVQINAARKKKNLDPVQIGIAINSGMGVAGPIGPPGKKQEFTVIGDTVNLASRMEGLNVKLGTDILVTHSTFQLTKNAGFSFKAWGLTPVRGRVEPVFVYQLLGRGTTVEMAEIIEEKRRIYYVPGATLSAPQSTGPIPASHIASMNQAKMVPTMGRFEIRKEIAKGAMGAVYLGHDPGQNRPVAIKTMRFGEELSPEEAKAVQQRFVKEAGAAGRLNHPAIVKVYEAGEDQGIPYIAMEFLDGEDLSRFCKKGALPPLGTTLEIAAQIAEALDYAHSLGIVHRDIKPGNIMILKDRTLRITDFGIARITESSKTATGMVMGTPSYMSPEQISGKKADGRSDLFSLGVMLFELLTGEKPFKGGGENIGALLFQIAMDPHPDPRTLNPQIPVPLVEAIDRALKKKPEERFQTGREMGTALRACLKALPQPAPR